MYTFLTRIAHCSCQLTHCVYSFTHRLPSLTAHWALFDVFSVILRLRYAFRRTFYCALCPLSTFFKLHSSSHHIAYHRMSAKFLLALSLLIALRAHACHISSRILPSFITPRFRRGNRSAYCARIHFSSRALSFTPTFASSISRFALYSLRALCSSGDLLTSLVPVLRSHDELLNELLLQRC